LSTFVGTNSRRGAPVIFHASGATSSKSLAATPAVALPIGTFQSLKLLMLSDVAHVVRCGVRSASAIEI
jgi:hypothetical protein